MTLPFVLVCRFCSYNLGWLHQQFSFESLMQCMEEKSVHFHLIKGVPYSPSFKKFCDICVKMLAQNQILYYVHFSKKWIRVKIVFTCMYLKKNMDCVHAVSDFTFCGCAFVTYRFLVATFCVHFIPVLG